jgi:Ser/Thr protein kinase RdoA (MazF antagonist)
MHWPEPLPMPTPDDFLEAAGQAAVAFGLDVAGVELLSHSENVVCNVTTRAGERLVMRLHRPGYNTRAELDSEVAFVDSLRAFGVRTPKPVPATGGGHYATIDVGGVAHEVGVISWVDGAPLGGPLDSGGGDGLVAHYREIGKIAAQVRSHDAVWKAPAGFERRRWDADALMGPDPLWGRFWEAEPLNGAQRALFARGRECLHDVLAGLSIDSDHFGLIHSDLHLGNVMAHGDQLTVIDFDDCGYGWFVHELAVALHPVLGDPIEAAARASLVEGYRSVHPLSDAEVERIDTFLAVRSLMIVGWLAARPEVPAYPRFPDLAAETENHLVGFLAAR